MTEKRKKNGTSVLKLLCFNLIITLETTRTTSWKFSVSPKESVNSPKIIAIRGRLKPFPIAPIVPIIIKDLSMVSEKAKSLKNGTVFVASFFLVWSLESTEELIVFVVAAAEDEDGGCASIFLLSMNLKKK